MSGLELMNQNWKALTGAHGLAKERNLGHILREFSKPSEQQTHVLEAAKGFSPHGGIYSEAKPQPHGSAKMKRQFGFTLVELLIVIAILMILLSLLSPSLTRAYETAMGITCMQNYKNIASYAFNFSEDHNGHMPGRSSAVNAYGGGSVSGQAILLAYITNSGNVIINPFKLALNSQPRGLWDCPKASGTGYNTEISNTIRPIVYNYDLSGGVPDTSVGTPNSLKYGERVMDPSLWIGSSITSPLIPPSYYFLGAMVSQITHPDKLNMMADACVANHYIRFAYDIGEIMLGVTPVFTDRPISNGGGGFAFRHGVGNNVRSTTLFADCHVELLPMDISLYGFSSLNITP